MSDPTGSACTSSCSPARLALHVRNAKEIAIGAEIMEKCPFVSQDLGLLCLSDKLDHVSLFGFNVRSLQDWEQGRRPPEIPIRAYLAVIQRDPEAVIRAARRVSTGLSSCRYSLKQVHRFTGKL